MLIPAYKNEFKRDVKRIIKRRKDKTKLYEVIDNLINQRRLPERFCDHALIGDYKDYRECHIQPDWLLIYRVDGDVITFARTGSHADLFK